MAVIAETDVKKDARNRITLPASEVAFEHYHVLVHDDGHIELHPQVLTSPTISVRTLAMIDDAMANVVAGIAGKPVDPDPLLALLGEE